MNNIDWSKAPATVAALIIIFALLPWWVFAAAVVGATVYMIGSGPRPS